MGYGTINIWIHERKACGIASVAGDYTVSQCCGKVIKEGSFVLRKPAHAEVTDVPPGCYIVTVRIRKPEVVMEIMAMVTCGKHACVNFVMPAERG